MSKDVEKSPGAAQVEAAFNPFGAIDPEPTPECCGKPMDGRLARMRDSEGMFSYVAVWRCLVCGRAAS